MTEDLQTELTLLQFIALALPAVAILLQAMTRYHGNLDSYTSEVWTEIRLIQYSFYALAFAGILFSIPLFLSSNSLYVQGGILVAGGALFLLIPATWFGLRRGRYAPTEYDSPEQEAILKLKKSAKFIVPLVVILALFFSTSTVIEFSSGLVGSELVSVLSTFASLMTGIVMAIAVFHTIEIYVKYKRESEEIQKWKVEVSSKGKWLIDVITIKDTDITDPNYLKQFRIRVKNIQEDWDELISSAPQNIDAGMKEQMKEISLRMSSLINLIEEAVDTHESKTTYHMSWDDLEEEYAELKRKQTELESVINEEPETQPDHERNLQDINDKLEDLHNRISNVETKIERVKNRQENIQDELLETRDKLVEDVESFVEKLDNSLLNS